MGTWPAKDSKKPPFNYDFWYQPRCNLMISTEWGNPKKIKKGFSLLHLAAGWYSLNTSYLIHMKAFALLVRKTIFRQIGTHKMITVDFNEIIFLILNIVSDSPSVIWK